MHKICGFSRNDSHHRVSGRRRQDVKKEPQEEIHPVFQSILLVI